MALAAEAWPAQHRAKATSYVAIWLAIRRVGCCFVNTYYSFLYWMAWYVLMVGIIPALVAWVFQKRNYMNQKSFVQSKEDKEHSHTNSFKLLVKDVRTTKTSIGVAILTSVQNFGYYGIMIWLS